MLAGALVHSQEPAADRVTVPFSDASRPRVLKVSILNGGVTVKGYSGNEAVVEARVRAGGRARGRQSRPDARAEGLRRIDNNATGLSVEERENVVSVSAGISTMDLTIQVPFNTALQLKTLNDGEIAVENVAGEVDANNLNGPIKLTNVSGAVVAHSLNKDVTAVFDKIAGGKPMSFSTLNGDVDVTLPAGREGARQDENRPRRDLQRFRYAPGARRQTRGHRQPPGRRQVQDPVR